QQVTTREANNLIHLAETRAHDLRLVVELLEVVVNPRHRRDPGVLVGGNVLAPTLLPIPVVYSPDGRRGDRHAGRGAADGLGEAEEQRQVAVDPFAFQLFGGPDAFPGAGNLDQDALAADPGLLVHAGQLAGLGEGSLGVETEAGIDLGGD